MTVSWTAMSTKTRAAVDRNLVARNLYHMGITMPTCKAPKAGTMAPT